MLTPSPWQRFLLFISPLILAGLLLWIPVRDALEVGPPDAPTYEVDVPEGHRWVAFEVPEDEIYPTDGATVSIELEFETLEGTVGPDSRTLLFDLEDEERVGEVTVMWPDGREQRFSSVAVDTLHELTYPRTINDALSAQWELRGAFYRFWGWIGVAVLVVLFALRVLSWAQTREAHA